MGGGLFIVYYMVLCNLVLKKILHSYQSVFVLCFFSPLLVLVMCVCDCVHMHVFFLKEKEKVNCISVVTQDRMDPNATLRI